MKPAVPGMPSSENMQIDITAASTGRVWTRPARSSTRSCSSPSRASTETTVNAPIVMNV